MILDKKENLVLNTNDNSTEIIKSEIHDSSIIIDYLRNKMYNNKIQTPVQEYISNAIDAMVSIDSDKSIRITLPTGIKQELKIRDYGPGLSEDAMKKVFTQYANSSKTSSDKQVGGYGLGSKSAWAYTPVFFVSSFFEGKKYIYIARIGDNQEGEFVKSAIVDTQEENGLEISIPVTKTEDVRKFVQAVYRASMLRKNKPEIIGDSLGYEKCYFDIEDVSLEKDNYKVIPKTAVLESTLALGWSRDKVVIVVSGIPYALPDLGGRENKVNKISSMLNRSYLVLDFKTGEVDIQPDRERISENDKTLDNIKNKIDEVYFSIVMERIKKLKGQKNLKDYLDSWNRDGEAFSERTIYTGSKSKSVLVPNVFKEGNYNFLYSNRQYRSNSREMIVTNLYSIKGRMYNRATGFFERNIVEYGVDKGKLISSSWIERYTGKKIVRIAISVQIIHGKVNLSNDNLYAEIDEEITEYQLKRKLKKYLSQREVTKPLVILPKGICDSLGIETPALISIKDMTLPEKQAREVRTGISCFYYDCCYDGVKRRPDSFELEDVDLEDKYVYMTLESNKNPKWFNDITSRDQNELIAYLNNKGYKFRAMGKKSIDLIKDQPNFISFENYVQENSSLLGEVSLLFNRETPTMKFLKKSGKEDFEWEDLNNFIKVFKLLKKSSLTIPRCLIIETAENKEKLNNIEDYIIKVKELLEKELKLVSHSFNDYLTNDVFNELVDYSNFKISKLVECNSLVESDKDFESIVREVLDA